MNTNLALGFLYSGDIWDEDTPYELHDVGYEMLAELKGKDLVEVVRCENCKHAEPYNLYVDVKRPNEKAYMCVRGGNPRCYTRHPGDFFCANGGKRRETE